MKERVHFIDNFIVKNFSKKPPTGEFLVLRFRELTKSTLHFCKIRKFEIVLYLGKGTVELRLFLDS